MAGLVRAREPRQAQDHRGADRGLTNRLSTSCLREHCESMPAQGPKWSRGPRWRRTPTATSSTAAISLRLLGYFAYAESGQATRPITTVSGGFGSHWSSAIILMAASALARFSKTLMVTRTSPPTSSA